MPRPHPDLSLTPTPAPGGALFASTPADDALAALHSRPEGLTDAEARAVRERVGPNSLPEVHTSPWRLLLRQFQDVLIYILLAALLVSLLTPFIEGGPLSLESFLDAIVIAAILVLNALLGFVQEYKAEQAIAHLAALAAPHARVRRGGTERIVEAAELVPGDVIVVEAGDRVPADGRLLEVAHLCVDESSLTGESQPVDKSTDAVAADTSLADQRGMLFGGTLVTRGEAELVVTATGLRTETGRIAELVGASVLPETPLQARLKQLGRMLGLVALILCVVVVVVGLLRGLAVTEILLVAVSLAVSAVPEGLAAVVTVCFALGVRRMAAHNVLVRRLDALETLGSVTVICTDKTGTVTCNRMTVVRWWRPDGGDDPLPLATAMASCSSAELPDMGDPTELALVRWAADLGAPRHEIDEVQVPFTSEAKLMRTRHGSLAFIKGSTSRVLAHVGAEPELAAAVDAAAEELARQGLRVLTAARVEGTGGGPEHVTVLGVVGLEDPPREGVAEAVAEAAAAGIRTVMITGDNLTTARSIAARVGIVGDVLTGRQLQELSEQELSEKVPTTAIYARVSPQHKVAICEALLAQGEVVSMSGDGVNDAPALKRAHVGVAMGLRGTEVARDAAAIVLADDNFTTIVRAIREGRRIHDNIRKFVLFLLRANFDELLLVVVAVSLGLPLPLLPIHILWVNLMTDGLPALALSAEPAEPGIMQRPPRHPRSHILEGEWGRLVGATLVGFTAILGLFVWRLEAGDSERAARTAALTLTIVVELIQALSSRSRRPIWQYGVLGNRWMLGAIAFVLGLHLVLLYSPLGLAFRLVPLPAARWAELLLIAAGALLCFELMKHLRR